MAELEPGMPRRNRNVRGGDGRRTSADYGGDGGSDGAEPALADIYGPQVYEDFAWFCTRDDGWLRVVPHPGDGVTWVKWKFTRGRFAGRYILVRCLDGQLGGALGLLKHKWEEAYRTGRGTVRDTAYDGGEGDA